MSQNNSTVPHPLPDYNLEVPAHLRYVLVAGLGSGIIGLILAILMPGNQRLFANVLLIIGIIAALVITMLAVITNNQSRLAARRKMMDAVAWRGDEVVLDVGCGNGFLLLEAAKHLTTGKAIGIDIWQEGTGEQSVDAAWRNAHIEGVQDKIDVQNIDAHKLDFAHLNCAFLA